MLKLRSFKRQSFQGDSKLIGIYELMGVRSEFDGDTLIISKIQTDLNHIELDLNDTPDIAQTIAVTSVGLGVSCHLSGLHTLAIKETDRLLALKTELNKLGAAIDIAPDSLYLYPSAEIKQDVIINTYDDHRMAMAFAALGARILINIANAEVVSKSYPSFWDDMHTIGIVASKSAD